MKKITRLLVPLFVSISTLSFSNDLFLTNHTIVKGCNTSSSHVLTVCDSYLSPSGKTWTNSGIYLDTTLNNIGCDSILFFNLTVHKTQFDTVTIHTCDSLISPSGKIWFSSGIYQDTISTIKGCDSIMTIYYLQGEIVFDTILKSDCDSLISPSGKIWRASGTYSDTLKHIGLCDSIFIYNLTILTSTYDTVWVSVCDSFVSPTNKTWKISGIYQDTLNNSSNCNLFRTYYITLGEQIIPEQSVFVCDTFISPSGKIWTTSGLFYDTVFHLTLCDSLFSFSLQVGNTMDTILTTVCDSSISPSGKTILTTGIYLDTLKSNLGCDSIIYYVDVTVNSSYYDTISVFNCDTVFSTITQNYWTATGFYTDTIYTSIFGCDSTITYDVTIGNSLTAISQMACYTYTVPSGDTAYTQSGWYYDTLTTPSGCDSVLYITLEINIADTTVYQYQNGSFVAFVSGASYNWLDCNNGYSLVDTNQHFIPTSVGSYALRVSKYGCIDTSSCYSIHSLLGTQELNLNTVLLYPNPTSNTVLIEHSHSVPISIYLYDVTGNVVMKKEKNSLSITTLNIQHLPSGTYLIKIQTEKNSITKQLIKL